MAPAASLAQGRARLSRLEKRAGTGIGGMDCRAAWPEELGSPAWPPARPRKRVASQPPVGAFTGRNHLHIEQPPTGGGKDLVHPGSHGCRIVRRARRELVCAFDGRAHRVRLLWHRIWQPSPDEPLDFEKTIEATVLELRKRFNVRACLYDPWQMIASAQRPALHRPAVHRGLGYGQRFACFPTRLYMLSAHLYCPLWRFASSRGCFVGHAHWRRVPVLARARHRPATPPDQKKTLSLAARVPATPPAPPAEKVRFGWGSSGRGGGGR